MKKMITTLLALAMILSLAACGGRGEKPASGDSGKPAQGELDAAVKEISDLAEYMKEDSKSGKPDLVLKVPEAFYVEFTDSYIAREGDNWSFGDTIWRETEDEYPLEPQYICGDNGHIYAYYSPEKTWMYDSYYYDGRPETIQRGFGEFFDPQEDSEGRPVEDYAVVQMDFYSCLLKFYMFTDHFESMFVEEAGEETICGVKCLVYERTDMLGETKTFWVDPDTGLTLKYTDTEDPGDDDEVTVYQLTAPDWNEYMRPGDLDAAVDVAGSGPPAKRPYVYMPEEE